MGFDTEPEFLQVDGNSVRAEVDLVDHRPGREGQTVRVTFEGSCP